MRYLGLGQQAAGPVQVADDVFIGVGQLHARVRRRLVGEAAVARHRRKHGQVIAHADFVVFQTMSGRGVHATGALFQRHVLSENQRAFAVEQGMAGDDALQLRAGHLPSTSPKATPVSSATRPSSSSAKSSRPRSLSTRT